MLLVPNLSYVQPSLFLPACEIYQGIMMVLKVLSGIVYLHRLPKLTVTAHTAFAQQRSYTSFGSFSARSVLVVALCCCIAVQLVHTSELILRPAVVKIPSISGGTFLRLAPAESPVGCGCSSLPLHKPPTWQPWISSLF